MDCQRKLNFVVIVFIVTKNQILKKNLNIPLIHKNLRLHLIKKEFALLVEWLKKRKISIGKNEKENYVNYVIAIVVKMVIMIAWFTDLEVKIVFIQHIS